MPNNTFHSDLAPVYPRFPGIRELETMNDGRWQDQIDPPLREPEPWTMRRALILFIKFWLWWIAIGAFVAALSLLYTRSEWQGLWCLGIGMGAFTAVRSFSRGRPKARSEVSTVLVLSFLTRVVSGVLQGSFVDWYLMFPVLDVALLIYINVKRDRLFGSVEPAK